MDASIFKQITELTAFGFLMYLMWHQNFRLIPQFVKSIEDLKEGFVKALQDLQDRFDNRTEKMTQAIIEHFERRMEK